MPSRQVWCTLVAVLLPAFALLTPEEELYFLLVAIALFRVTSAFLATFVRR